MAWWKLEPFRPTATNSSGLVGSANDRMQAAMREQAAYDRFRLTTAPQQSEKQESVWDWLSDPRAPKGPLDWATSIVALGTYAAYWFPYTYFDARDRKLDHLGPLKYPILLHSYAFDMPLYAIEAVGLTADVANNWVIRHAVRGNEDNPLNDHGGKPSGILPDPLASRLFGDPEWHPAYLPGWHCSRCSEPGRVDFHFLWWDHFYVNPDYGR